jgi:hypothetical protein
MDGNGVADSRDEPPEDVQQRNEKISQGYVPATLWLVRLQEWDGSKWIDRWDSEVTTTANKVGTGNSRFRWINVCSWPMPLPGSVPYRWRGTRRAR